jgi:biopolymer transport protein ExbB/biopolymer transport protein TolQ
MQFTIAELWSAMGLLARGVVIALVAMSVASLAVALERWLSLRRSANNSVRFVARWRDALRSRGYVTAAGEADGFPGSPVARLVADGTKILAGGATPRERLEAYDRAARLAITEAGTAASRGLPVLATVGSTAPFVGLFGTVAGIVNAFRQMAVSGQGGLATVSGGIAEALVTTALGIVVAIPAVWLFNHLTHRRARLLADMQCAAEELSVAALCEDPPRHQSGAARPAA